MNSIGGWYILSPRYFHAICEDTLILEIQQSSDTTYRVYDYDRLQNGAPRELHIDKSIAVTNVPHKDYDTSSDSKKIENATIETLVEEKYFSVMFCERREWRVFSVDLRYQCFDYHYIFTPLGLYQLRT